MACTDSLIKIRKAGSVAIVGCHTDLDVVVGSLGVPSGFGGCGEKQLQEVQSMWTGVARSLWHHDRHRSQNRSTLMSASNLKSAKITATK
jgi:hypothetical protein